MPSPHPSILLVAVALLTLNGCNKSEPTPTKPTQASTAAREATEYPALTEQALLSAFQRGAHDVPDYVRIASVKFQILEGNPPAYFVKGNLTYEIVSDTFRPVGAVGVERNKVTLVEPVQRTGETFEVGFSQRVTFSSATSTILPPAPLDWKALGQPRQRIARAVERDSAEGAEAIRQAEIYETSQQKLDRIGDRSVYAKRLLDLVSDEGLHNAGSGWLQGVEDNLGAFGYRELVNEIDGHVFNNAAFAKLTPDQKRRQVVEQFLAKEIIPEAERLVERAKVLKAAMRQASDYFAR